MIKKNNLRKIYMAYIIAVGELFTAVIILCIGSLPRSALLGAIRILTVIAMICIPIIMYVLYRVRGKDNAASSDEREQLVLTKAFALTGLTAITLLPFLLFLTCFFNSKAAYVVLGYAAVVIGTIKIGVWRYNKKF